MELKKPQVWKFAAVLCALSIVVFAALGMGYTHRRNQPPVQETAASPSVSAESFRTERQQLRAMQKAQINEIMYSENSDPEIVNLAQKQLLDLLRREEQEGVLEGLITMRGFEDVIVAIQKDSASIFVRAEMLTQQESGMILDLVCRETGLLSGNIKIIPVN